MTKLSTAEGSPLLRLPGASCHHHDYLSPLSLQMVWQKAGLLQSHSLEGIKEEEDLEQGLPPISEGSASPSPGVHALHLISVPGETLASSSGLRSF